MIHKVTNLTWITEIWKLPLHDGYKIFDYAPGMKNRNVRRHRQKVWDISPVAKIKRNTESRVLRIMDYL